MTARPRRSILYMPGSNARALDKARSLAADGLIFDLEDAVAPDAKPLARRQVADALAHGGYGHREIGIRIKASLEELVSKELEEPEHDAFDTHPPLALRIQALEALRTECVDTDDRPAVELLENHDAAEARLIRGANDEPLEPLAWSKVARRVYLPSWQKQANRVAAELSGPPLGDLVKSKATLGKLAARILKEDPSNLGDAAPQIGANLMASAVCVTLANAGWQVKNSVGRQIVLRDGEKRLTPFRDFGELAAGELSKDELLKRLTDAGVHELRVHTSA